MATPNAPPLAGPGIQYVRCALSSTPPTSLTESTFQTWYDTEHVPDVISTSGMPNAFRALHVDKTSPHGTRECAKPFMAFYPMPDLAFTQGEEFKEKIRVSSDMLPGDGLVFNSVDFDIASYAFAGKSGAEAEAAGLKYFVGEGLVPGEGTAESDVAAFLDRQTAAVAETEGYVHSRRFRHLQTRVFTPSKAEQDAPPKEMPAWLVIHSFSAEPKEDVRETLRKASSGVLASAKQYQVDAYRLHAMKGKGKFFDSEEDGTPI